MSIFRGLAAVGPRRKVMLLRVETKRLRLNNELDSQVDDDALKASPQSRPDRTSLIKDPTVQIQGCKAVCEADVPENPLD